MWEFLGLDKSEGLGTLLLKLSGFLDSFLKGKPLALAMAHGAYVGVSGRTSAFNGKVMKVVGPRLQVR